MIRVWRSQSILGQYWTCDRSGKLGAIAHILINPEADRSMVRKRKRQRQPENESPFQKLREDANLSQEELAVRIGVSASTIRRWEKGDEPTMNVWQMREFCRAVGVSFDELPAYLSRWVNEEES